MMILVVGVLGVVSVVLVVGVVFLVDQDQLADLSSTVCCN